MLLKPLMMATMKLDHSNNSYSILIKLVSNNIKITNISNYSNYENNLLCFQVNQLCISSNRIVSVSSDHSARVYCLQALDLLHTIVFNDELTSAAISAEGKLSFKIEKIIKNG